MTCWNLACVLLHLVNISMVMLVLVMILESTFLHFAFYNEIFYLIKPLLPVGLLCILFVLIGKNATLEIWRLCGVIDEI